jgi:hypothetical protein
VSVLDAEGLELDRSRKLNRSVAKKSRNRSSEEIYILYGEWGAVEKRGRPEFPEVKGESKSRPYLRRTDRATDQGDI